MLYSFFATEGHVASCSVENQSFSSTAVELPTLGAVIEAFLFGIEIAVPGMALTGVINDTSKVSLVAVDKLRCLLYESWCCTFQAPL